MPEHDSTRELTAAIASGDTEAFARLYRERFDQMYAWARQATRRDEAFCMDAVQNAFVRIIKGMRPLESEGELAGWLRRVTLSACYDQIRNERRRAMREARSQRAHTDEPVDEERLAWIRNELAALDESVSSLLEMRYRFGWTLERIGRSLGIGPGAADGRIGRAVARLRTKEQRGGEVRDE